MIVYYNEDSRKPSEHIEEIITLLKEHGITATARDWQHAGEITLLLQAEKGAYWEQYEAMYNLLTEHGWQCKR